MILKRVPAHERKSISRNLFIFGPMLIRTFCLFWGGEYPGKVCDIGFSTPCIYIGTEQYIYLYKTADDNEVHYDRLYI